MPIQFGVQPSQLVRDLIGYGDQFPFNFSEQTGGVATYGPNEGLETINSAIFFVLSTRKGEYPMHPAFGSNLPKLLHENWTSALKSRLELETATAIQQWVPQIELLQVASRRREDDPFMVEIGGVYRLHRTTVEGSFVFPFQLGTSPLS